MRTPTAEEALGQQGGVGLIGPRVKTARWIQAAVIARIMWHWHSCLCQNVLVEETSTGRSAGATQVWSFLFQPAPQVRGLDDVLSLKRVVLTHTLEGLLHPAGGNGFPNPKLWPKSLSRPHGTTQCRARTLVNGGEEACKGHAPLLRLTPSANSATCSPTAPAASRANGRP